MKTKTFLMVCLLGIGLTQLSAQPDNKKGNGTIEHTGVFSYWQPVYCDGQDPDLLLGETIYDGIEHYKNGIVIFQNFHNIGHAVSENTGEKFVIKETDKQYPNVTFVIFHFNLIGDQGSHYLGSMTWDWTTDAIEVNKFVCVENKKK